MFDIRFGRNLGGSAVCFAEPKADGIYKDSRGRRYKLQRGKRVAMTDAEKAQGGGAAGGAKQAAAKGKGETPTPKPATVKPTASELAPNAKAAKGHYEEMLQVAEKKGLTQHYLDSQMQKLSDSLDAKGAQQLASDAGFVGMKSKKAVLDAIRSRVLGRMETSLNTSFGPRDEPAKPAAAKKEVSKPDTPANKNPLFDLPSERKDPVREGIAKLVTEAKAAKGSPSAAKTQKVAPSTPKGDTTKPEKFDIKSVPEEHRPAVTAAQKAVAANPELGEVVKASAGTDGKIDEAKLRSGIGEKLKAAAAKGGAAMWAIAKGASRLIAGVMGLSMYANPGTAVIAMLSGNPLLDYAVSGGGDGKKADDDKLNRTLADNKDFLARHEKEKQQWAKSDAEHAQRIQQANRDWNPK